MSAARTGSAGLLAALALATALAVAGCGGKQAPATATAGPAIRAATIVPAAPLANSTVSLTLEVDNPSGGNLSYACEWFVDGRPAQQGEGLDFSTHGLAPGAKLMARIKVSDGKVESAGFETAEVAIAENLTGIDSVRLDPSPVSTGASAVTAVPFPAPGSSSSLTVRYHWIVAGRESAETGPTLSLSGLKQGDKITVEATPVLGDRAGNPFRVSAVAVNDAPQIRTVLLASQDEGAARYQIAATDPDGDAISYQLVSGPAGAAVDAGGLVTIPKAAGSASVRVRLTDATGNWIERELGAGL
ncbi:MAG: hypothetical protein MUF78_07100 [Candidatus Edwardsbacteria bacterium]|jgi:hypothetical protein|nr:hypothetical protein [Candidatus Edwardsbacteria bacterium]